jgi:hypothetical protein
LTYAVMAKVTAAAAASIETMAVNELIFSFPLPATFSRAGGVAFREMNRRRDIMTHLVWLGGKRQTCCGAGIVTGRARWRQAHPPLTARNLRLFNESPHCSDDLSQGQAIA